MSLHQDTPANGDSLRPGATSWPLPTFEAGLARSLRQWLASPTCMTATVTVEDRMAVACEMVWRLAQAMKARKSDFMRVGADGRTMWNQAAIASHGYLIRALLCEEEPGPDGVRKVVDLELEDPNEAAARLGQLLGWTRSRVMRFVHEWI